MAAIGVATQWLDGTSVLVAVNGELDLGTAPALEERLLDLAHLNDGHIATVVVDLSNCWFLDSSALNALLHAKQELETHHARLALVIPPANSVRMVFAITGLDQTFEIYPSRDAA